MIIELGNASVRDAADSFVSRLGLSVMRDGSGWPPGIGIGGNQSCRALLFDAGAPRLTMSRWGFSAPVGIVREWPFERIDRILRCSIPVTYVTFEPLDQSAQLERSRYRIARRDGQLFWIGGIWQRRSDSLEPGFAVVTITADIGTTITSVPLIISPEECLEFCRAEPTNPVVGPFGPASTYIVHRCAVS